MQKIYLGFIVILLIFSPLTVAENALKQFAKLNHAGLLVVGKAGEPLFSEHADKAFIPASTTKLITAWLALKQWGRDYHFKTDFYLDKNSHTLWVKGSGDPFLVSEELQQIVKNLKKLGLKRVDSIGLDTSLFVPHVVLPGAGKSNNPYDAVPSAVAANFNSLKLKKIKGKVVSAERQTPITAYAKSLSSQLKSKAIRINTGPIPENSERYFAELLAAFMREQGITVGDNIVRGKADGKLLFYTHKNSRSLAEMIKAMLKYSTNFLANQLVLVLSSEVYQRPANAADVQLYMETTLAKQFNWKQFTLKDGAGLSRDNKLSPAQLVDLLYAFKPWKDLLPEVEAKVYAKSGTMGQVSTLAGYILNNKQWQPFAIMINQTVPYKFRNRVAKALAKKVIHNR